MSQKKYRLKPCDYCHQSAKIRYRIQYNETKQWQQVCPDCWRILSQDNPLYRYGGTWKARRR